MAYRSNLSTPEDIYPQEALNGVALSATLHCLTGCAIGEIAGMAVATALGLSNEASIALAIFFAFLFGYTLTSLPLLRAGLALSVVVPIAFASDTFSIALMEIVDNAIIVMIPGAIDAMLGDLLFWGSLTFSLAVAGVAAYPLNRWLISKGKATRPCTRRVSMAVRRRGWLARWPSPASSSEASS